VRLRRLKNENPSPLRAPRGRAIAYGAFCATRSKFGIRTALGRAISESCRCFWRKIAIGNFHMRFPCLEGEGGGGVARPAPQDTSRSVHPSGSRAGTHVARCPPPGNASRWRPQGPPLLCRWLRTVDPASRAGPLVRLIWPSAAAESAMARPTIEEVELVQMLLHRASHVAVTLGDVATMLVEQSGDRGFGRLRFGGDGSHI
jgi:hypothetical protein